MRTAEQLTRKSRTKEKAKNPPIDKPITFKPLAAVVTTIPEIIYSAPYPGYDRNNTNDSYSPKNHHWGYWRQLSEGKSAGQPVVLNGSDESKTEDLEGNIETALGTPSEADWSLVTNSAPPTDTRENEFIQSGIATAEHTPQTEKFKASDLRFLTLVLDEINKWIKLNEVKLVEKVDLESLHSEEAVTQFNKDFYKRLQLVFPTKLAGSLSTLEKLNDDITFKKVVMLILRIDIVLNHNKRINYAVSKLPTIKENDSALIIKLWYFLVNQPKKVINLDQKMHKNKKSFEQKAAKERDLYQRWQRLVQLPPEKLVVLFLSALGIPFSMIDTFLDFAEEHSSKIVKEFFDEESMRVGITNECRILSIAALSYTIATVLTFNPFTNQLPEIKSMEAEFLKDASKKRFVEAKAFFMDEWYEAAGRKSPLDSTRSQRVIARNSKVSLERMIEFFTEYYQVRTLSTDSSLLAFSDLIWLERATYNQPRTFPSHPN